MRKEIQLIEDQYNQEQYQAFSAQYLESNQDGGIGGSTPQERIQLFERFVPRGRRVLEIGAGSGDEAQLLEKAGYQITASDIVPDFIKILREKGLSSIEFNAKKEELPQGFDAIYANAVFVHFSTSELAKFLREAKEKLEKEKIIFLSVIKGQGMARDERGRGFPRDFQYYNQEDLKQVAIKEGYSFLYLNEPDDKWLQAIITANPIIQADQ